MGFLYSMSKDTTVMVLMENPSPRQQHVPLGKSLSLRNSNTPDSREHLPFSSCIWAVKGRGKAVRKARSVGSDPMWAPDVGIWLSLPFCASVHGYWGGEEICRNEEPTA